MLFRSILVASFLTLSAQPSHADLVSVKCDGPTRGPVRVIKHGSACQGFTVGDKSIRFSRLASGHLLASKDGRTVVMIEDYLPARVKDGKTVEALYDIDIVLDPRVLVIYRDGKRVAFYDLARLVKHLDRVEHSISHIRWVAALPPSLDGDRFTLTTTTKRELVFDTRTGKLVEERDVE